MWRRIQMDSLQTVLAANTPFGEVLDTSLPEDMTTVPLAEESREASIEDVAEGIDRSIYAALVSS
jgi:hypothetical protein